MRVWRIAYVAHDGRARRAFVLLPRWYGPERHPVVPLVISPHGRGETAWANTAMWGDLPALGRFAVVSPEGQGRRLALDSWGDPGEIRDLARMPELVHRALPWLRMRRRRIYAVGDSMGGQEVLLLVARYPAELAGAAAFDAPTDLSVRYRLFVRLKDGLGLQKLLAFEIGAPPWLDPRAYALRSPLFWAREIAFSGVPLEIWWSRSDGIVRDQARQSGLLFRRVMALNPLAPVEEYVGTWRHGSEMGAKLPIALRELGLLPPFASTRRGEPDWGRTIVVRR